MGLGLGNANANNWLNNPPGSAPGFSNKYSIHFDGVNQYLLGSAVPLLGALGTGNWSVSFWIKCDAISTGSNQRIWSSGAGGVLQTQMYLTGSGNLQFGGPWSDGFGWGVSSGTWHHLVYRVNTGSTTLNVGYVLDGSTYNNTNRTITTVFDTSGSFFIGRNSGTYGFEGNIDEFAIWNKYLSDAECLEIYNGGSGVDLSSVSAAGNLQNWWRMGDPNGTSSYPTISGAVGSIDLSMTNQASSNIETDVP